MTKCLSPPLHSPPLSGRLSPPIPSRPSRGAGALVPVTGCVLLLGIMMRKRRHVAFFGKNIVSHESGTGGPLTGRVLGRRGISPPPIYYPVTRESGLQLSSPEQLDTTLPNSSTEPAPETGAPVPRRPRARDPAARLDQGDEATHERHTPDSRRGSGARGHGAGPGRRGSWCPAGSVVCVSARVKEMAP